MAMIPGMVYPYTNKRAIHTPIKAATNSMLVMIFSFD